ncbi:flagellar brake protein [Chitinibacteraceae bacterium HSL-7]
MEDLAGLPPLPEGDELADFTITNPLEVGGVLRALASSGEFVSVHLGQGRLLVTRILAVDMPKRVFYFDMSGQEALNTDVLRSPRHVCTATPDGVREQFVVGQVRQGTHDGRPAFVADFPADLIKLQRRQFFRISTPVVKPYECVLRLQDGRRLRLPLRDISLGGLALWLGQDEVSAMPVGARFERVGIELGAYGVLEVNLEVRNWREAQARSGETRFLVGCQFFSVNRQLEASLQKAMVLIERDRKELTG